MAFSDAWSSICNAAITGWLASPKTGDATGALANVGARFAGEGAHKNAFAGKPGSYEKRFNWH